MTNADNRHKILESDEAFVSLRISSRIQRSPSATFRQAPDVARQNKLHPRRLNGQGIIKAKNFKNAKNKAAYMYIMTPEGITTKAHLARQFMKRNWKSTKD